MSDPTTPPAREDARRMVRNTFAVALVCPHCGRKSRAVWETSVPRKLVGLGEGFHFERGRTADDEVLIVCNECDEILPPA